MPVAAMMKTKFRKGEIELNPGDTLFVYTDGVTDNVNTEGESFGLERTVEALNRKPDGSTKELNDIVGGAVDEFRGEEPQFDDTTMVVMKYFGPKDPAVQNTYTAADTSSQNS